MFGGGDHEDKELLRSIRNVLQQYLPKILLEVKAIHDILTPKVLFQARISIMPKTIQVGQTALATIQGFDQNGNPFPIDTTYQVAYSASADVSFGPVQPDGSDVVTGTNPDPGATIEAVITGGPKNVNVTATPDTLVIEAAPPVPQLTTAKVVLQ